MPSAPKHILIVEKEPEMRSILRDFFTHRGYKISAFSSPLEATRAIEKGDSGKVEVDLVISDLLMTPTDGLEFAKSMKERYPRIGVILISSFGNKKAAIEVDEIINGHVEFVHKPFSLDQFEKLVAKTLKKTLSNETLKN